MSGVTRRSAAVVAAMVLLATACADDADDPISAPSTTEEPAAATTAETTTAETTSTMAATTTTTGVTSTTTVTETTEPRELPYWTEECTEVAGDGGVAYAFDPTLEEFTTLGPAPTLDLVMPQVVTSAGPYGSIASTRTIPGGVLIGVYPPSGWPTADEMLSSSSLVAVNDDGTVRWRRCFDDDFETRRFAVAPADLEPDVAWVASTAWDEPLRIVGVDLATGADVAFPARAADLAGLTERGYGSSRVVVLGPQFTGGPVQADDRLLVVDTLDGSITDVPVPPSWVGSEGGWAYLIDADPADDEVVLADRAPGPNESAALYLDGSWTEDPAVQRDLLPLQVTESFGEPFELHLLDGSGDQLWAATDFHGIGREGFRWAIADDVVVAVRCAEWDTMGVCTWVDDEPPAEELVAFDLETGVELWSTPGGRALTAVAGNTALATARAGEVGLSADGYVLLDLTTGDAVPGATWPAGSFDEGCCGEGEYLHVSRTGGVVVATDMDHVRVWYPPELTTPTVTVDLMG